MTDTTDAGGPERLDRIAADVAALAARVPSVPAELVTLPAQVDALGAAVTEIRVRLGTVTAMGDRVEHLEELLTFVARQLATDAEAMTAPIAELTARVETFERRLDGLGADIEARITTVGDSVSTRVVSQLAARVGGESDARLDQIERAIERICELVASEDDTSSMSVMVSSTETLARAFEMMSTRTERRLADSFEAAQAAQSALRALIEPAMTRLDGIESSSSAAQWAAEALMHQAEQRWSETADLATQAVGAAKDARESVDALIAELHQGQATQVVGAIEAAFAEVRLGMHETVAGAAAEAGRAATEASVAAFQRAAGEAVLSEQIANSDARAKEILSVLASLDTTATDQLERTADVQAVLDEHGGAMRAAADRTLAERTERDGQVLAAINGVLTARVNDFQDMVDSAVTAQIPEIKTAVETVVAGQVAELRNVVLAIIGAQTNEFLDSLATHKTDSTTEITDSLKAIAGAQFTDLETVIGSQTSAIQAAVVSRITELLPGVAPEIAAVIADQLASDPVQRVIDVMESFATDQVSQIVEAVVRATHDAMESAGRSLLSDGVTSLERAANDVEANVQRSTDAALDAMMAAIDGRLAGFASTPSPGVAPDRLVAALTDTLDHALETKITPTLRSAGRAIAEAAGRGAAQGSVRSEEIVAAVREAVDAAVAEGLDDAIASLSQVSRGAAAGDLTPSMLAAIAGTLDDFGERIEADVDEMGRRLENVAAVLQQLIDELAERRRGLAGGAVDLLRQVAAEAHEDVQTTNSRRRSGPRGTLRS